MSVLKMIFALHFVFLIILSYFTYSIIIYNTRDLSLMVKYETFNLCYAGSNPTGLTIMTNGYRSMVGLLSSTQMMSVQIRLAV